MKRRSLLSTYLKTLEVNLQSSFTKKTSTLDVICDKLLLKSVDFLKADCEGAEPELLYGSQEMLKITKKVAIDTGAERLGKTTYCECEKILKKYGFHVDTIFYHEKEAVTLGWRE